MNFFYSIVLIISFLIALFLMWRFFKNNLAFLRFRVTLDLFFDSVFIFLFSFGLGARALYIIEHWSLFQKNILWWFLFLHFPGFSFLGGVIGGLVGLFFFCKQKNLPFLLISDLLMIGSSFTLASSRIGSFLEGGKPAKAYLLESIAVYGIFALLYYLYKRGKTQTGFITVYFFLLIGLERFFIEMVRADSVYLGRLAVAQVISLGFVLFALSVLFITKRNTIFSFAKQGIERIKNMRRV